jgi:hypothetical protein
MFPNLGIVDLSDGELRGDLNGKNRTKLVRDTYLGCTRQDIGPRERPSCSMEHREDPT